MKRRFLENESSPTSAVDYELYWKGLDEEK